MEERLAQTIAAGGPWLLPLGFLGGLCTSLNPCAYPLMGAVAGYVWANGGRSWWRGLAIAAAFLLGLVIVYGVLGAGGAFVGATLGLSRTHWRYLTAAICLTAGAVMAKLLPVEIPGFSPLARTWHRLRGIPGAFLMGALLGLVATPCATPALAAILSVASSKQSPLFGFALMVAYAVGHALPAIGIALFASSISALRRFEAVGARLQVVGAWLIIAVGLYLLGSA